MEGKKRKMVKLKISDQQLRNMKYGLMLKNINEERDARIMKNAVKYVKRYNVKAETQLYNSVGNKTQRFCGVPKSKHYFENTETLKCSTHKERETAILYQDGEILVKNVDVYKTMKDKIEYEIYIPVLKRMVSAKKISTLPEKMNMNGQIITATEVYETIVKKGVNVYEIM